MGISPNTARGYLALVGFVLNFALLYCGCVYAISAYDLLMPKTVYIWDGRMFYWLVLHCISYIVNAHICDTCKIVAKERTMSNEHSLQLLHSLCCRHHTFHLPTLTLWCQCLSQLKRCAMCKILCVFQLKMKFMGTEANHTEYT